MPFRFQLYAQGVAPAVNWRLLSGNNRDMGRGVGAYRDGTLCLTGLAGLLRNLDQLDPLFVRVGNNRWRWFLLNDGEPVITSGHSYDRKMQCTAGHVQFVKYAPGAVIGNGVVVSSPRRWSTVALDQRDGIVPT